MNRFFIPRDWLMGDTVTLKDEPAHQIRHVLRLKPADRFIVLDNTGREYKVELETISGESVKGRVTGKAMSTGEPALKITLFQALLKADKFEFVLQKGVELGVSAFVPFTSERCMVKAPTEARVSRWQKIIQEAAEQSGRGLLPTLHPVVSFSDAYALALKPAILLWEEEKSRRLRDVLREKLFTTTTSLSLFIGPEGGFPHGEVEYAESKGIVTASLGRRVLRAETAGLAAVSAILYARGELG
jgi:16S rRNA (uracil1498-N3)-methyltransferase